MIPVIQAFNAAKMKNIVLTLGMQSCGLGNLFSANMTGNFFLFFLFHLWPFSRSSAVLYRILKGKGKPGLAVEEASLAVCLARPAGDDHRQFQGIGPVDDLLVADRA